MLEMSGGRKCLSQETLDEIVRRVVEVAQPEQIVLFGSAARGEMGPHSDVDLLVVKRGEFHSRDLAWTIRKGLRGIDEAFDIIVVTPEDVERYRDAHALVICPAVKEGRVLYAA